MRGKSAQSRRRHAASQRRFNEARALCAGSPAATAWALLPNKIASMRPAHYAREVTAAGGRQAGRHRSFNEARALCAGSPRNLNWPSTPVMLLQ